MHDAMLHIYRELFWVKFLVLLSSWCREEFKSILSWLVALFFFNFLIFYIVK